MMTVLVMKRLEQLRRERPRVAGVGSDSRLERPNRIKSGPGFCVFPSFHRRYSTPCGLAGDRMLPAARRQGAQRGLQVASSRRRRQQRSDDREAQPCPAIAIGWISSIDHHRLLPFAAPLGAFPESGATAYGELDVRCDLHLLRGDSRTSGALTERRQKSQRRNEL